MGRKSEAKPPKPWVNRLKVMQEKRAALEAAHPEWRDPRAPKPPSGKLLGRPLTGEERRAAGGLSLPGSFWDRLKALSDRTKRPMSWHAERAFKAYFLEAEK